MPTDNLTARSSPDFATVERDDDLLNLATECERASGSAQMQCLSAAIELIARSSQKWPDLVADTDRAARLAAAGALESAVMSLIPETATLTGARLADGTVVAQVVLSASAAAHSRKARTLAMAWLAACLRALSRHEEGRCAQESDA